MDTITKMSTVIKAVNLKESEEFCFPNFSIHGPFCNEAERAKTHRRAYTLSIIASGGYVAKQDLIEVLQYIEDMVSDE